MSRLRSLLDRQQDVSDVESEREALQRQRLESAAELEGLKAALAARVAHIQERERELEQALARVAKREQALSAAKGPRLKAMSAWLAETQAARSGRGDERDETIADLRLELAAARETLATRELELASAIEEQPVPEGADLEPPPPVGTGKPHATAKKLAARARELDARAADLDEREARLEVAFEDAGNEKLAARDAALAAAEAALAEEQSAHARRADELNALERTLAERESALSERERPRAGEHGERAEARLDELRAAELAFVKTRAELAARSDALAEQELELAMRERDLLARDAPPSSELDALEARIRRLEQGGRSRKETTQTFSAGLRALQERGLRSPSDGRNEPLH